MRYLTAGLSLLAVLAAPGTRRSLGAQSAPAAAPIAKPNVSSYAYSSAARAGVSLTGARAAPPFRLDTAATAQTRSHRVAHAAIGAGIGLVVGAGIGGALAASSDGADEAIGVPAAAYGVVVGGAIGLVIGAVAGAFVR